MGEGDKERGNEMGLVVSGLRTQCLNILAQVGPDSPFAQAPDGSGEQIRPAERVSSREEAIGQQFVDFLD